MKVDPVELLLKDSTKVRKVQKAEKVEKENINL
jgi:hypothetical protein